MVEKSQIINLAKNIGENTKSIVSLGNTLFDEAFTPVVDEDVAVEKPSTVIESALSSLFNSGEELKAKKLLSAALLIAKKQKMLPAGVADSINGIASASISDEALTKMKGAYQVATGKIDVYKATDLMIDRATARMTAVSDVVVRRVVDVAIDKVGTLVAHVFPVAIPVVMAAKAFQPYITKKTQQLVKKGIKKIGEVAKKSVRKLGSMITNKIKISRLAKLFY